MQVTVAIPFYNAESTLLDAIRSVYAQTFTDWHLILMDDGSTDKSLEIACSIRDSRVTVYSDGENRGLPTRLNQTVNLAQGQYYARMDADDLMHPQRLELQMRYFIEHPDTDLVGSAVYAIDAETRPVGLRACEPMDPRPIVVIKQGLMAHPTLTGRTDWFRSNPYNPKIARTEDYELWCRTCQFSTFRKIDLPLLYYRECHRNAAGYLCYYASNSHFRRITLRMHGPRILGWPRTLFHYAGTYAKVGIYCAATILRAQRRLIRLRNHPLSPSDLETMSAGLREIFATRLPGVD